MAKKSYCRQQPLQRGMDRLACAQAWLLGAFAPHRRLGGFNGPLGLNRPRLLQAEGFRYQPVGGGGLRRPASIG
jgi:hypothetical protein